MYNKANQLILDEAVYQEEAPWGDIDVKCMQMYDEAIEGVPFAELNFVRFVTAR